MKPEKKYQSIEWGSNLIRKKLEDETVKKNQF
jgi:hypothetical protein